MELVAGVGPAQNLADSGILLMKALRTLTGGRSSFEGPDYFT